MATCMLSLCWCLSFLLGGGRGGGNVGHPPFHRFICFCVLVTAPVAPQGEETWCRSLDQVARDARASKTLGAGCLRGRLRGRLQGRLWGRAELLNSWAVRRQVALADLNLKLEAAHVYPAAVDGTLPVPILDQFEKTWAWQAMTLSGHRCRMFAAQGLGRPRTAE